MGTAAIVTGTTQQMFDEILYVINVSEGALINCVGMRNDGLLSAPSKDLVTENYEGWRLSIVGQG